MKVIEVPLLISRLARLCLESNDMKTSLKTLSHKFCLTKLEQKQLIEVLSARIAQW
jgi:hypothetical protein